MSAIFFVQRPKGRRRPILVSCPHSGIEIPPDVRAGLTPALAARLPDTDWYVHELYGFAPELGITLIHARFSRYVIDLNRDPAGKALYHDGRLMTGLVPTTSFAGEPLRLAGEPTPAEIAERLTQYYWPYHAAVRALLAALQAEHGQALLWEAHSIKRFLPLLNPVPFPDMILGDQDGKTAAPDLASLAAATLSRPGEFKLARNAPFKGGFLTRSCGEPARGIHALQLEMAQDIYMDQDAPARDPTKQAKVQRILSPTLAALADCLERKG